MKKILATALILGTLLLVTAQPVSAQEEAPATAGLAKSPLTLGFLLGLSLGRISGLASPPWGYRTALMGGGFLNIPFGRVFSLEPQLYFAQKGAQYSEDVGTGDFQTSINISVIELPVLFRITIPLGPDAITRPRFFGGPFVSYLTRAVLKQIYTDFYGSEASVDTFAGMKKIETGFIAGAGVEFDVKGGLFSIDARYSQSFGSVTSTPEDKKNKVISIVLGFTFK
jgi:hypothetical protein